MSDLINYRKHPQDYIPKLIENKIPVFMVAGDSDTVVPYEENGKILEEAYKQNNIDISIVIKTGCNHHPHGLVDNSPIIEFAEKYYI